MILYIQLLLLSFTTNTIPLPVDIDSSNDQLAVEEAVLTWANNSFQQHANYKFEHFKAHYTDDYFIQTMRLEQYGQKLTDLEEKKANGEYSGSEENYQADYQKLKMALENATATIDKIDRVTHYETHFWTNIQTTDGITVYYELIVKLNNSYELIEATENSSIGKKSSESKIAYKTSTDHLVIEK